MSILFNRPLTIKIKQGLLAYLKTKATMKLSVDGEPFWTTDTKELYIAQDGNMYGISLSTAICHEGEIITYNNEIVHG